MKNIDILFVAWNRFKFTQKTLTCLLMNTDFERVRNLVLWDDGSTDGTAELLRGVVEALQLITSRLEDVAVHFRMSSTRSPVAVMNQFLLEFKPDLFAKIDSDTCVPAGWLEVCAATLDRHPTLDLLGIECMKFPAVAADQQPVRTFYDSSHIGGIGLMRSRAFERSLPRPDGRFGFTAWQNERDPVRGFLEPALPVCLLDHVPEPKWRETSIVYTQAGWQRDWGLYGQEQLPLWSWIDDLPDDVSAILGKL